MRKPNTTTTPSNWFQPISNPELRIYGLKDEAIQHQYLESKYMHLSSVRQTNQDVIERYNQQDWRVEFNVLLKILGFDVDIETYLKNNNRKVYRQEEDGSVYFSNAWGEVLLDTDGLKNQILFSAIDNLDKNFIRVRYKVGGEVKILKGAQVIPYPCVVETEDGIYCGPIYGSGDGTKYLCSKELFASNARIDNFLKLKQDSISRSSDSYRGLFRLYQSLKTEPIASPEDMTKQIKDLKEYVKTLPEVTRLELNRHSLSIELGWRWISDNQMVYTPRYVPPITLYYSFEDKKFGNRHSDNLHPHCMRGGDVCLGEMADKMFKNIKDDFYIGLVKSMYEFGMTWSSEDAAGTERCPAACLARYLGRETLAGLSDENIRLIANEVRFRDIIEEPDFYWLRKRIEGALGGRIDIDSLLENYEGIGSYFLIDDVTQTPEIRVIQENTTPGLLDDNLSIYD